MSTHYSKMNGIPRALLALLFVIFAPQAFGQAATQYTFNIDTGVYDGSMALPRPSRGRVRS